MKLDPFATDTAAAALRTVGLNPKKRMDMATRLGHIVAARRLAVWLAMTPALGLTQGRLATALKVPRPSVTMIIRDFRPRADVEADPAVARAVQAFETRMKGTKAIPMTAPEVGAAYRAIRKPTAADLASVGGAAA